MKKLILMLTVFCLSAVCFTVPVFAADADSRSICVNAKYVGNLPWKTAIPNENGTAKIVLSDGTEVSVSGITDGRWTLAVDEITDKEALEYIDGVTQKELSRRVYLHIFFFDENGEVRTAEGVNVSVKLPNGLKNPTAYVLSGEKTERLPVSADGSILRFTATDGTIYVLGNLRQNSPSIPKTGGIGNTALWTFLVLVGMSCACLTRIAVIRKKRYI